MESIVIASLNGLSKILIYIVLSEIWGQIPAVGKQPQIVNNNPAKRKSFSHSGSVFPRLTHFGNLACNVTLLEGGLEVPLLSPKQRLSKFVFVRPE